MSITVVVAGDLCAAGRPAVTLAGPDFGGLWSDVSPINAAADFSIVNLECPLTDRADPILKAGPHLWAPAGCIQGVQAGGFTAACLANNHILDAGSAGLLDTIEACRQVGMLHVGAAANSSEACTPLCVSLERGQTSRARNCRERVLHHPWICARRLSAGRDRQWPADSGRAAHKRCRPRAFSRRS